LSYGVKARGRRGAGRAAGFLLVVKQRRKDTTMTDHTPPPAAVTHEVTGDAKSADVDYRTFDEHHPVVVDGKQAKTATASGPPAIAHCAGF
jgi:hypothetical protein